MSAVENRYAEKRSQTKVHAVRFHFRKTEVQTHLARLVSGRLRA